MIDLQVIEDVKYERKIEKICAINLNRNVADGLTKMQETALRKERIRTGILNRRADKCFIRWYKDERRQSDRSDIPHEEFGRETHAPKVEKISEEIYKTKSST